MNDTSKGQDPIAEIKKAEEAGKEQLEKLGIQLNKKEEEFKQELQDKREEFTADRRDRGIKKLETVKEEAGQLLKSKMATAENEKNKIISDAQGKESSAIDLITTVFTEQIKK